MDSEKDISITVERQTKKNGYHCILCNDHEIQKEQDYYDIEIRTTRKIQAQAIILLLASMKKGFEGEYNRPIQIKIHLCEFHYSNLSESLPLNQEIMVDFNEFKKIFKSEKLETTE